MTMNKARKECFALARVLTHAHRGQAIAEMLVIAPLLILLLIGLVELGRFAKFSIITASAARAGVAYGAQNATTAADTTGMQNAALTDAESLAGLSVPTATTFCQCADGTTSTCLPTDCPASHTILYVKVIASGSFSSLFRYPGLPGTFAISSQATMRVPQ
jgi:Flp pilus assembly protein TadG